MVSVTMKCKIHGIIGKTEETDVFFPTLDENERVLRVHFLELEAQGWLLSL